jgi:hypothetical protein
MRLVTQVGVSHFRSARLGDNCYVVIIITGWGSSGCDLLWVLSWRRLKNREKKVTKISLRAPFLDKYSSRHKYENNQQDALYRLIYYSKSALHVSGDVFAHHQENLTVFTVSGSVHQSCCRMVSRRDTSRQQLGWTLPDAVNTVKFSWWWAKTSPETCRADLE